MTLDITRQTLRHAPRRWLVTGAAGFIGSHLVQHLLELEQFVTGLDNLSSGSHANLEDVRARVTPEQWERFRLVEGDIRSAADCWQAVRDVEVVLHHAAHVSVPGSLADPIAAHEVNATGFLNVLHAVRQASIPRLVYASSSAVYGDSTAVPCREESVGRPLSPYAATKRINEIYAEAFGSCYGLECIGLRYFNVYGPRQDPNGHYAAVIPKWVSTLTSGGRPTINGSGSISRDFVHVQDVVQANLLAATVNRPSALNRVYNIGQGRETTLDELFALILEAVSRHVPGAACVEPLIGPPREGDIEHSAADITRARELLGYDPRVSLAEGLSRLCEVGKSSPPDAARAKESRAT